MPQVTELARQIRATEGAATGSSRTRSPARVRRARRSRRSSEHFQGTTAIAFTGDDPVALAKALTTFAKTAPASADQGGAWSRGGRSRPPRSHELATLPGKPELYAKLLFLLNAPMVGLVTVLNAAPQALLNVLAQAEKKQKGES